MALKLTLPPKVSLSASPNPVPEGSAVTVTATLSAALSSNVDIPVTLTRNTSEAGDHGTLSTITITAGATRASQQITTNHDPDLDDETFTVALDTANLPSSVTAGTRSSVQIRIVDDEGAPTARLVVSPTTVTEGSPISVEACLRRGTSTLSAVPQGTALIPVIVTPGTAEERDYGEGAPRSDGIRWYWVAVYGHNGRSCGAANFPTHRDGDHDDETLTVALDTARLPSGMNAGSPSSVAVTIRDLRDAPETDLPPVRTSAGPDAGPYATLISRMREFRNDPRWVRYKAHTDRWDRALRRWGGRWRTARSPR